MKDIAGNIERVRRAVAEAELRYGRRPGEVSLLAVTKNHPREAVLQAYEAGQRVFGENRVQEAAGKYADLPEGVELHMLGHLQSNKAKTAAGLFTWVQSVDSLRLARELDGRCAALGRRMKILVEVNTSGEEAKGGYRGREALLGDLEEILALRHLDLQGLMTLGPLSQDEGQVRSAFARLRTLAEELRSGPGGLGLPVLSMGMSGDFPWAIAEGSTLVRLGTAIFGERNQ